MTFSLQQAVIIKQKYLLDYLFVFLRPLCYFFKGRELYFFHILILHCKVVVTPQNVIFKQNVIRIAAKCNTNAKCNNIDAKCNKIFNAKCNNLSTQIVITFLTHNLITQNVIISEITTCTLFQNRYCGSVISS